MDRHSLIFKSLEQIESGAVLGSSTVSINRLHVKSNESDVSLAANESKSHVSSTKSANTKHKRGPTTKVEISLLKETATHQSDEKSKGAANVCNNMREEDTTNLTNGNHPKDIYALKGKEENEQKESLLSTSGKSECADDSGRRGIKFKLCCCCRQNGRNENESSEIKKKRKSKLISWSVLKDTRFQCYVFATFCFTIPSNGLFLPALAKSKGVSGKTFICLTIPVFLTRYSR